uniref:Uncharacterized protein n=1 Tax=Cannabis sativa TaxID=3483 RepID=A0A803PCM0_CANSA
MGSTLGTVSGLASPKVSFSKGWLLQRLASPKVSFPEGKLPRRKGLSVGDCSLSGHEDGLRFLCDEGEACILILFVLLVLWQVRSVKLLIFAFVSPRDVVALVVSVLATRGFGRLVGICLCA